MIGKRVVVTGVGAVTPLGANAEEDYARICNGESSIRDISGEYSFLSNLKVKIGSVYPPDHFEYSRRMSKFSYLALDAAKQALTDAGLVEMLSNPESERLRRRTGVLCGCGLGGLIELENQKATMIQGRPINQLFLLSILPDAAAGNISSAHHSHGTDSPEIGTACATGNSDIMYGAIHIREDNIDIALSGGTVEVTSELTYRGFSGLRAISPRGSRPFDRDRDGFVLGEGAGLLVLEELDHAKARGASDKIYAELLGYGCSTDGGHFTEPNLDYQIMAMQMALDKAGLRPEQIDYINCHGTSTFLNDITETKAIKAVFGSHAYNLVCSSMKGALGHTTSASGGIENAILMKAMKTGIIPPTLNLQNPDIEHGCDLDYNPYVPGQQRKKEMQYVMKNSFGFFGHNVVLVFGKYDEN